MNLHIRTLERASRSGFLLFLYSTIAVFAVLAGWQRLNADEPVLAPVPAVQNPAKLPGTPANQEWHASSLSQRQDLAEQIGENGAAIYAAEKGYVPLMGTTEKITLHGPDGVYYAPDGKLVVIEAKGGTSSINRGYGYEQGTAEHAVASAKRMLKQDGIPLSERAAYETIIKEAARGNLRVETVRTTHVLGKPDVPKMESVKFCTTEAAEFAKRISKELSIPEVGIERLLRSGKNVALKGFGGVGAVGGGFQMYSGVQEIRDGKIVEGSLDTAGGLGNAATGCLVIFGKAAPGATLGAAVAVVDGAKDIVVGIRDADTKRTVVGAVKLAAGSAMSVGLYTRQPVVVVIGGVTYVGVIIYEQKEAIAYGAGVAVSWTKHGFDAAWNGSAYAAQKTGEALSTAKDAAWNTGVDAVHKTGEALSTAKDAAWNTGVNAVRKAASARDAAWNRWFK
jgi:hypothetical protein